MSVNDFSNKETSQNKYWTNSAKDEKNRFRTDDFRKFVNYRTLRIKTLGFEQLNVYHNILFLFAVKLLLYNAIFKKSLLNEREGPNQP